MAKLDFEKALNRLEQIVAEMEASELNLDQMLAKFKEGVKLAEACSKRLHEAERTVETLVKGEGGSVETKPFTPEAGAPDEDAAGEAPF